MTRLDVADQPLLAVGVGVGWAVRAAVAAPVEGDDAVPAAEVGHLALPLARMDDRRRGEEHERRLARAEDLVGDPDAIGLGDDARLAGSTAPASAPAPAGGPDHVRSQAARSHGAAG